MIDFIIYLIEGLENQAVRIGPRRKARRQHRENMKNTTYHAAYRAAFYDKIEEQHAWGQGLITFFLIIGVIACPCLWIYFTFVSHEKAMSTWVIIAFLILAVWLFWLQRKYYEEIRGFAIEAAGKALREEHTAQIKAKQAADKKVADAAAKAKAEEDKKRAADIKAAHEVRKAAVGKKKESSTPSRSTGRATLKLTVKNPPT